MRFFLKLAYDGSNYCGWQVQKKDPSIQQQIEENIGILFKEKISIIGCGRTDTGVHAQEYYAHFNTEKTIPEQFLVKINHLLPDDIVIQKIFEVNEDFHARFSAKKRAYEYHIHQSKNPFLKKFSTEYRFELIDWEKVREATELIKSYRNFEPMTKANADVKTHDCIIYEAKWIQKSANRYIFYIEANRFLHNMVRRLVGTLMDIGKGKLSIAEFDEVMKNNKQFKFVNLAPAQGLRLVKITYPEIEQFEPA